MELIPLSGGLAQIDQQAGLGELLGVCLGPAVLGLLMFAFGLAGERSGMVKGGIKWLALVPLGIGLIMGWDYLKTVSGELGQTFIMLNMIDKKVWLYRMAFYFPLIVTIALPVWAHFSARNRSLAEDEAVIDAQEEDAGYEEEEEYEVAGDEEFDEFDDEDDEEEEEDDEPDPRRR